MQSLEDWLGAALFARKRGQLRLTPAGAEYHKAVCDVFDLLSIDPPQPSPASNRLRLTVVPTFALRLLIPRLQAFRARYPELSLSIDTSHRLADFPGDGFDAGIRLGAGTWPDLYTQHLLTETLVPVCAPGFFPNDGDVAKAPDDMLIYTTGTDDGWRDWAVANGRSPPLPERGLRVDTMRMALSAAEQGMGIALARMPTAKEEIGQGGLVALDTKPVPCRQSYWFVTSPRMIENFAVRAFLEWLREEMGRLQG